MCYDLWVSFIIQEKSAWKLIGKTQLEALDARVQMVDGKVSL